MFKILRQDIINNIERNFNNDNQEYKFKCNYYGKEFYGDNYTSIINEITNIYFDELINNYVVRKG